MMRKKKQTHTQCVNIPVVVVVGVKNRKHKLINDGTVSHTVCKSQ